VDEKLQIAALILAAGEARRFGEPKQLLPWGETTILGQVIGTVSRCLPAANIHLVLGAHYERITSRLARELRPLTVIRNRQWADGMFSSICAGLESLRRRPAVDGILLLLGDMPFITAATLRQFIDRAPAALAAGVPLIAAENGRPAHPYLVWRLHIGEILSLTGESGIRPFIGKHFPAAEKIPVSAVAGRRDIDTWDAYYRWRPAGSQRS